MFPEATNREESFGEVSPSTVSASKLADKAFECIFFKLSELSLPSIKTKLSKVAKSGLIIPDPFANPVIATFLFPMLISLEINFGFVSVVRIDRAAAFQFF